MVLKPLLAILILVFASLPAAASPCTEEDWEYAKFWDNYYEPEEAYAFGAALQRLVTARDVAGLYALAEAEMANGPARARALISEFSDLFSDEWRDLVLAEAPRCSPVGWRGFMLGRGMIWYDMTDAGWRITALNRWKAMAE